MMDKPMTAAEFYGKHCPVGGDLCLQDDIFDFAEAYAAYRERIMAEKAFCAAYYDGMGNQTVENVFSDWWKEQQKDAENAQG